jgi:hypothetical protein
VVLRCRGQTGGMHSCALWNPMGVRPGRSKDGVSALVIM